MPTPVQTTAATTTSAHTTEVSLQDLQQRTIPDVPHDIQGVSPIIYGTSAFAALYNPIEDHWPAEACRRAIDQGINTFDTSPYYGNSEEILGKALATISSTHPRSSYYLSTKVGRYGVKRREFDYSAKRVRLSVEESMQRLKTNYLDIVFAHDVEFVSIENAVEAVGELFRLKAEGKIRYVGISGYPLPYLLGLIPILHERHNQPLDIILTYCHYNLHNTLLEDYIDHFKDMGVRTVWNASPVSMGLLRSYTPVPDWHPAPKRLVTAVQDCIKLVNQGTPGKDLAEVAVKFAMRWKGCEGLVLGMSNAYEVEQNVRWWKECQALDKDETQKKDEKEVQQRLKAFIKMEWPSPPLDDC